MLTVYTAIEFELYVLIIFSEILPTYTHALIYTHPLFLSCTLILTRNNYILMHWDRIAVCSTPINIKHSIKIPIVFERVSFVLTHFEIQLLVIRAMSQNVYDYIKHTIILKIFGLMLLPSSFSSLAIQFGCWCRYCYFFFFFFFCYFEALSLLTFVITVILCGWCVLRRHEILHEHFPIIARSVRMLLLAERGWSDLMCIEMPMQIWPVKRIQNCKVFG